jgi:hypothetical protein
MSEVMNELIQVPLFEQISCPHVDVNELRFYTGNCDLVSREPLSKTKWWQFIRRFQIWRYRRTAIESMVKHEWKDGVGYVTYRGKKREFVKEPR